MRVLALVNDASAGGAQSLLTALYEKWPDDDVHLLVLLGRAELSERMERSFATVTYLGLSRNTRNLRSIRRRAQRVIDAIQPDVVHSNLTQSDLVSLVCDVRGALRVSTTHTSGTTEGRAPENPLATRAVALLSRRFDAVIGSHESCREHAKRTGLRLPDVVIPNGVVIPHSRTPESPDRDVLSLARWHPMKGHADLFAAFVEAEIWRDGWTLTCAGPGMSLENDELLGTLWSTNAQFLVGDRIRLLGPRDDVGPILGRSSVVVLSSRYGETYPMAGMEACASARPVIATDVGGSADFVVDRRFLVPPGDYLALGRALRCYADLPEEERQSLGTQSWERAKSNFSIEGRRAAYRAVFSQGLDGRR
jgi:glycosyltransferase involved in cell wall biosynthesis